MNWFTWHWRPEPTHRGHHENTARDIARSAYEDVVGPHDQTHRGDPNA